MADKTQERIWRDICKELKIPYEIVKATTREPFAFTGDIMRKGDPKIHETLKSVYIMGFGTFHVSKKKFDVRTRKSKYYKNKKEGNDRSESKKK